MTVLAKMLTFTPRGLSRRLGTWTGWLTIRYEGLVQFDYG